MPLIGNTHYQASSIDPGPGYPMFYWNQTDTGFVYIRNAADNAWVKVGDSAQPYLGQLSTQGGAMNGAITGAHGLAHDDANNFTGSLQVGYAQVSTQDYVNDQIAILNANIATSVASALASIPSLNFSARVATQKGSKSYYGAETAQLSIPLPYYSDGVQAAEGECIWYAAITSIQGDYGTGPGQYYFSVTETATKRTYNMRSEATTGSGANHTVIVEWFIIGFRSS